MTYVSHSDAVSNLTQMPLGLLSPNSSISVNYAVELGHLAVGDSTISDPS